MADMSFDVVYAGGGYGALMSAPYFCMNGMSVGIFEALPELGGGHASDARPLPGFTGNPHAHAMVAQLAPQIQDFKVWEYGGNLRFHDASLSCVWTDGDGLQIKLANQWDMKTGLMHFDPAIFEENYELIAKINKHDAEVARDMIQKMLVGWMGPIMMDWLNPPPVWPEREWIEKLYEDPDYPIDPRYQYMSPVEAAKDLFEDPRIQMFAVRIIGAMAFWPDKPLTPSMFLLMYAGAMLGFMGIGHWEGGTHQAAHALQRVLAHWGGKAYVNHPVDKILVENGRAKGIKLVDGTEIEAKKLVVTNVDPRQLTFRFLRDANISDTIKRKVNNIVYDIATLFWGNVAYHEPPKYIAAEKVPNIGNSFAVIMGDGDIDYINTHYRYHNQAIRPGQWPEKMYFWESPQHYFDPRMAPPGKGNSLIEEYGPPASAMTEREWVQVRREVGPRMIAEWRKYAPNMTDDNIIGIEIDTPGDFACRDSSCYEGSWQMGVSPIISQWGRHRPITEFAQYKVPGIDGLYCTGIGWHSNFGSPAGYAYNMYKQAAWDLGLREFWKEAGRDW